MSNNPYDFTRPVDNQAMFFGRRALLDQLVSRLCLGRTESFPIYGGRRSGKTSLLRTLECQLNEKAVNGVGCGITIPIYLDMQFILPGSPADFFHQTLLRLTAWWKEFMHEELSFELVHPVSPAQSFANIFISFCQEQYPRHGSIHMIILVDETEKIQRPDWAHELDDNLRSLLSNQPGVSRNLGLVMTGGVDFYQDMLSDKGASPLRNVMSEEISLNAVAPEDMLPLIDEPTGGCVPRLVAAEVMRQAGGSLFLGQYLMKHIWDEGCATVTVEDVREIAASFSERRRDFDGWVSAMNEDARRIYELLVRTADPLSVPQIADRLDMKRLLVIRRLDILRFVNLVQKNENCFTPYGEMFRAWFDENFLQDSRDLSPENHPQQGSQETQNGKFVININGSSDITIGDEHQVKREPRRKKP